MRVKVTAIRTAPTTIRDFVSRVVHGHDATIPVQRRELPYWQEHGWKRTGNKYNGSYQTRHGAFWGEIVQHSASDIEFYLYQPSPEIQRCDHWACFQHRGNDWYLVHMGRQAKDVSSGIITIERLITEAYDL